jgi:hypothetical protein
MMFSRTFTAINLLVSITTTTTTTTTTTAAAAARRVRIKGAILGGLIGDSLALCGHYEYDAKVIADRIGSYRELSSYS